MNKLTSSQTDLTITVLAHAPLLPLSVLEIGTNKSYINTGLLRHEIETIIAPQIRSSLGASNDSSLPSPLLTAVLSSSLSSSKIFSPAFADKTSYRLAISGFLVPLLSRYAPDALSLLQDFVKTNNVELLAVPYYGSSPSAISAQEFALQLTKEEEVLQEYFHATPTGFFSEDGVIPQGIHYETIVLGKELSGEIAVSSLTKQIIQTTLVALGHEFIAAKDVSELEQHLLSEYALLSPHVHATRDEDLLTEWRLLGQTAMFAKANPSVNLHEAYDHYAMYMNVLNDVAHKMRTVALGKQGLFLTKPELVASPASLLGGLD